MGAALTVVPLVLLAFPLPAQTIPEAAPPSSPCGPTNVKFDVKLDRSKHSLSQPQPGKALVYVIKVFQRPPGELGGSQSWNLLSVIFRRRWRKPSLHQLAICPETTLQSTLLNQFCRRSRKDLLLPGANAF